MFKKMSIGLAALEACRCVVLVVKEQIRSNQR